MPALRKALWEVAARIPGIELVGDVTDHAGRAGVAVERNGTRYVLDPSDGDVVDPHGRLRHEVEHVAELDLDVVGAVADEILARLQEDIDGAFGHLHALR